MNAVKRKKVENGLFNEQWTSDYCFILQGDKPLCLICKDTVGSVKKNNIKRHFDAKHAVCSGYVHRVEKVNTIHLNTTYFYSFIEKINFNIHNQALFQRFLL